MSTKKGPLPLAALIATAITTDDRDKDQTGGRIIAIGPTCLVQLACLLFASDKFGKRREKLGKVVNFLRRQSGVSHP
jgi:hypothetical protein